VKIAILAPIAWRTPPRKYGPWEQVASNIAEGLVEEGIDVTLFATGDSITSGKLLSVCERPYAEDSDVDPKVAECLHISFLMEQADQFDLIHNNYDFLPLSYSRLTKTPMVTTIHGFSSSKILPVYKKYNSTGYYVSISNSDRQSSIILQPFTMVLTQMNLFSGPYRKIICSFLAEFIRKKGFMSPFKLQRNQKKSSSFPV
jgi:hypothetical protein